MSYLFVQSRGLCLIVGGSLTFVVPLHAQTSLDAATHLRTEAVALENAGRHEEALAKLDASLVLEPESSESYFLRAGIFARKAQSTGDESDRAIALRAEQEALRKYVKLARGSVDTPAVDVERAAAERTATAVENSRVQVNIHVPPRMFLHTKERWVVRSREGTFLCTLPCTRWIEPNSGLYLDGTVSLDGGEVVRHGYA